MLASSAPGRLGVANPGTTLTLTFTATPRSGREFGGSNELDPGFWGKAEGVGGVQILRHRNPNSRGSARQNANDFGGLRECAPSASHAKISRN